MIIRVKHDTHYTVIRDKTLRDSRLSFKATGLLAYLLSLPDDATISRDALAAAKADGVRAVRSALAELTDAGYITHERCHGTDGKWRTNATVRERPISTAGANRASGQTRLPLARKPPSVSAPINEVPRRGATTPSPPPENLPSPEPITDEDRRTAARGLTAARAHLRTA